MRSRSDRYGSQNEPKEGGGGGGVAEIYNKFINMHNNI